MWQTEEVEPGQAQLESETVAHGLEQGARLVWMPTLSSSNHMHTAHRSDMDGD